MNHLIVALAGALLITGAAQAEPTYIETPMFEASVAEGKTLPVQLRVPKEPLLVDLAAKGREAGKHGGVLRTLIAKKKSVRYMNVWGYARLVGYDEAYQLKPDILRAVDVEEGRKFTFHLREGHKWSNGYPFTTEDFRYWWEEVARNEELSPAGPPNFMLVDGQTPTVSVIDQTTIVYEWPAPNPLFLAELAKARPPFIYRPAHYMRQFHKEFGQEYSLANMISETGVRNWAQLHNRMDNMYKNDNPDLPTLQPWMNTTKGKAQRYHMVRNPFFHRVDENGRQLPYIDKVEMTISATDLFAAKANAGEVDLQGRGLSFGDVAILKEGEAAGDYRTLLWRTGAGSDIALYPNLTTTDPVWRETLRDVRFRRALSMSIDRELINQTLYFGLAVPSSNSAIQESPLYDVSFSEAWAQYDPDAASALLDEMGLTERGSDGVRKLSDGRPLEIVVETAGERISEVDALQLITQNWAEIGVKLLTKPSDRDILRNRAYSGQSVMTVWYGWDNGVPTPSAFPGELAPTRQDTLSWPAWGQYYQTKGESGEAPDYEPAAKLMALYDDWLHATDDQKRTQIWTKMMQIHADEVFAIGTVNSVPQPVVASNKLGNVPEAALYVWDPGAQFGLHRIDEWFFRSDIDKAELETAPGDKGEDPT